MVNCTQQFVKSNSKLASPDMTIFRLIQIVLFDYQMVVVYWSNKFTFAAETGMRIGKKTTKNELLWNKLHRTGVYAAMGTTLVLGVVCAALSFDYVYSEYRNMDITINGDGNNLWKQIIS